MAQFPIADKQMIRHFGILTWDLVRQDALDQKNQLNSKFRGLGVDSA
jgi:hypothetical protein